jgi:hypothetical protein
MFATLRAKMQSNVLYCGDSPDISDGRKLERPLHDATCKQAPKTTVMELGL